MRGKSNVLYSYEESVRRKSVAFLVVLSVLWLGLCGYVVLSPQTVGITPVVVGTTIYLALSCLFVWLLVKGGTWYVEIDEEAIRWGGPLSGDRMILHQDVDSFDVLSPRRRDTVGPVTRVYLKSGQIEKLPHIGNATDIHRVLVTLWGFRGTQR